MNAIGQNYIDYWQNSYVSRRGLKNRFGVRVTSACCWALIQIGDEEPYIFGQRHEIPVDPAMLPDYLRMIVDQHFLTYPNSDLFDVLAGNKTVEEAIHSPTKIEPKRTSVGIAVRLSHAS